MAQQLFRVADVFAFESGLIIVATDCTWDALPAVLRIGDAIEFRRSDGSVFRTTIAGIPIGGDRIRNDRSIFRFRVGQRMMKSKSVQRSG